MDNQPTPAPAPGAIADDDFLNDLKRPTEGDKSNNPAQPAQPTAEAPKPPKPEISEAQMVSKVMVNFLDVAVQISCQSISGEPDETLFKVSEAQKDQIQKPLAELLEYYKIMLNPWWLLALAVVAVYAKPVSQAVGIKIKKQRVKKAAQERNAGAVVVEPTVEVKRGPGRPVGTTKDKLQERKNGGGS